MSKPALCGGPHWLRTVILSLGIIGAFIADWGGSQSEAEQSPPLPKTPAQPNQEQLDQIKALKEQVRSFQEKGQFDDASAALKKQLIVERQVFGEQSERVADSWTKLGVLSWWQGDFVEARTASETALGLQRNLQGEEYYKVKDLRFHLADVALVAHWTEDQPTAWRSAWKLFAEKSRLVDQGNPRAAVAPTRKAYELLQKAFSDRYPFPAIALHDLGYLHYQLESYHAARGYYDQALTLYKKVRGDHPETAQTLDAMGLLLQALGDYDAARASFDEALTIRKKVLGENHPDTAQSLNSVGLLLKDQGQYEAARLYLERSLKIKRETLGEIHGSTARSYTSLGQLLQEQGDFAAARPYFEKALAIRKKVHDESHLETMNPLNNLGVLLKKQGDYQAALPYLEQALAISRRVFGEQHSRTAIALNNLGTLLQAQERFVEASSYLEKVYPILEKTAGPNHPFTAKSLHNLGQLRQCQGNYGEAKEYYAKALASQLAVLGPGHPDTIRSLHSLGLTCMAQADFPAARGYLAQARTLQEKLAHDLLGTLAEAEGLAFVEATQYSRDPLLSILRQLPDASADSAYSVVWATRALVSRAVAGRRDRPPGDPEAAKLAGQLRQTSMELARLILARPTPDKARARQDRLAELSSEKERLERELARMSSRFRRDRQMRQTDFPQLMQRLPADVAVVDFIQTTLWEPPPDGKGALKRTRHYEAFVLRKPRHEMSPTIAWIHLGPAEPIDRAENAWRREISAGIAGQEVASQQEPKQSPEIAASGPKLRRLLWEPLEPHLAGCSTVIVIPDAALTGVAWAALPGKKPDSYLLDDVSIATASYGQQISDLLNDEPPPGDGLLLVGGVRYDAAPIPMGGRPVVASRGPVRSGEGTESWPFLEGTSREVDRIAELWQRKDRLQILKGAEARESILRQQMGRARYIHLATHGFFSDPRVASAFRHDMNREKLLVEGVAMSGARSTVTGRNPLLLSGVVLAGANTPTPRDEWGTPVGDDGILTAEEVADLDLRQTELVVLSACETVGVKWPAVRECSACSGRLRWPAPARSWPVCGRWTTKPPRR
jgi:tetratricopeptide (TPR) repeat protein